MKSLMNPILKFFRFTEMKSFMLLKKSLVTILMLGISMMFSHQSEATHMMGADITYKCLDSLRFEVTVTYYRDCRGVPLGRGQFTITCPSGGSQNVNLIRQSIKEITPLCATAAAKCNPVNQRSGDGIEAHTYTAILDFNRAPLSSLKNCSDKIRMTTSIPARNSDINTGAANQNFFTYAELDLKKAPCNSTPSLTSEPISILCCNQPFFFNNGALDITDFDSLSYSWAPPLRGWNQQIGYSGQNYAYNHPFKAFYPGSLKPPFNNINAKPPIGIYLDPVTGDIIFTPTRCDEVTVAVIQVKEWRKDTNGVYQEIGVTHRDLQFITKNCPDNNPPEIKGPFSYDVCEGSQLCFDVRTDDKQFIPPPPLQPAPPDTVTNSWNRGIPGATYTIINPTDRLQTGRFCWTPGANTASDLPYSFTVTARDNACPLNAVSVRAFRVRVKPRAQAERLIDTLDCGKYAFESDPIDGFKGTPSYRWTLLDSNRNIVFDKKQGYFTSTGNFLSTSQFDSIQFRTGGLYIIQHDINNLPINCPSTFYDSLVVPPLLEVDLSLGEDTFVCAGTDLTFRPFLKNAQPPLTYQWSTMGVTDDGDFEDNITSDPINNLDSFVLRVPGVQYDTAVSVLITDNIGCTAEDTVQVFLKANPIAILPPDDRICTYDSVTLVPNLNLAFWIDRENGDTLVQGDTLAKEWFYNGEWVPFSIADSVTINREGAFVLRVSDSLNCQDTDTFFLEVNDTVTALAGPDQIVCAEDLYTITAGGLDTVGTGKSGFYRWNNITGGLDRIIGTNQSYDRYGVNQLDNDSTYRLELYVTEGGVQCFDDDTVIIVVDQLPVIALGTDESVCCDAGVLALNFKINTPTGLPATGGWSSTVIPELVNNNQFLIDSACGYIDDARDNRAFHAVYTYQEPTTLCFNSDSIEIVVNKLPNLILQEADKCQDAGSIRLDDEVVISPSNTSLGSPSWTCLECNGNDFNNMLENRGPDFAPDFWLNVDETNYTIQNPDKDTVTLEFTYVNQYGCRARDTVDIRIWRVPVIEFSRNRDLCFDEGEISLDDLTGINLTDGTWSCYDSIGFEACGNLGGITGDTINTFNTINDNATHTWMMRYYHIATGCPAENFIPITVNPLPVINLTPLDPNQFCEGNAPLLLLASPAGGSWTDPEDPAAITGGNQYNPSTAQVFNQFTTMFYDYTSPTTGCSNVDSIQARTDKQPSITPIADTTFCRDQGQTQIILPYNLEAEDADNISWLAANTFGNSARASVSPYSDTDDETLTLNLQNAKADTFRIIIFAEPIFGSSCLQVDDAFDVIVNPIPDASILNSVPFDCNPVSTDLDIQINNDVNLATSAFDWDLGEGGSAATQTASATYTTDGTNNISVIVTSEHGCDTTLTSAVDVYPIPEASFTPNPNNYTTAALPRFSFNNTSRVDPILGSTIDQNDWDFGDWNVDTDTSTEVDPTHIYPKDTGSYMVTLTVTTNYGCTDTAMRRVVIGPDLIVFIPNAFTPDQAGPDENEGFKAIISGEKTMELTIFNRWGEILFQSTDKEEQWDGSYQGEYAQQDVYAYTLKVTALNDEEYSYSGTITLIR
jgi:gliding motility-associated-like protein